MDSEEFLQPKPKAAVFSSSPLPTVLSNLEESDGKYWEGLKISEIYEDSHPFHSHSESSFQIDNQASKNDYKQDFPLFTCKGNAGTTEGVLQYVDQLQKAMGEVLSDSHFKEFESIMEKRFFLIQQKFLSLERSCIRRRLETNPNPEPTSNPSLELCLSMVTPMLESYESIPLEVSFRCIESLIENGTKAKMSALTNLLHTNHQLPDYPPKFITKIRDWIETLLRFTKQSYTANAQKMSVESCILSLLSFGLATSSISCLLKTSQHLLETPSENIANSAGFTDGLQKLFGIALSEPQCFHHLDHFPMIIPDRKKYQRGTAPSTKELYCMAIDYTHQYIPKDGQMGEKNSNFYYLYANGEIYSHDASLLFSIPPDPMDIYPRHFICLKGFLMWYRPSTDKIECFDVQTSSLLPFQLEIDWPEDKGSREVASIFSEGEYIYFATGQSSVVHDQDIEVPDDKMENSNSSMEENKEETENYASSSSILPEKEKIFVEGTISDEERIASVKDVVIYKFSVHLHKEDGDTKSTSTFVGVSMLDHPYTIDSTLNYFLTDGKWLIITSSVQKQQCSTYLYAEFIPKKLTQVRVMQAWGTDQDWYSVSGPIAWDLKNHYFWEYDLKEKTLSWIATKTVTPKFLRAREPLSAQSLLDRVSTPYSSPFPWSKAWNSQENPLLIPYDHLALYIISAIDHIIQIRKEGAFTTERSSSVFEAILSILQYYTTHYISHSFIKEDWSIITGLIGALRILNIQIANCINENVAREVGLYPTSPNDASCHGVSIRNILFQLIRYGGGQGNKTVNYIQQLATKILFSFVEVLYHPDELGELIQSMVTRDCDSPQYKTFISLLDQMARVSNPSLLILTPLAPDNSLMEVKLPILNCLLQTLGAEFIAVSKGYKASQGILEYAGSLLNTIQGSLTLHAWRASKDKFFSAGTIERGCPLWIYCSFGDELLAYCIDLLRGVQEYSPNIQVALNNPLFTELLPTYIHSFWLSGVGRQALQIFYKQSGPFLELLEIIDEINRKGDDVVYCEKIDFPKTYSKKLSVMESKHPYMTEQSPEEIYFVDILTHPGALFMKLKFDPRSRIDKFDEMKFHSGDKCMERARLLMNGKVYYGKLPELPSGDLPTHDIIYIGDTLTVSFESCCYNSEFWGFRLEATAFFPVDIPLPLPRFYPLLDMERAIAMVFSRVITHLVKDPCPVSNEFIQLEKTCRQWIDSPDSVLHRGTTLTCRHHPEDEFDSILPQSKDIDIEFIHNLLEGTRNILPFLTLLKDQAKPSLVWTQRFARLFDPMDRAVYACLLHHTGLISYARESQGNDPLPSLLTYLWEQTHSMQYWAKNYHQQSIGVPFESICRSICKRAKFLLTAFPFPHKEIPCSKELCQPMVRSALSFLRVEELALDGVLEVLFHRTELHQSRSIGLELQLTLLRLSDFSSVQYCSLSQLSLPRHILKGLEGCNPNQTDQIIELYLHLHHKLIAIASQHVVTHHHTQLLIALALRHTSFIVSNPIDDFLLQKLEYFDSLHQILLTSSLALQSLSVTLLDTLHRFASSAPAPSEPKELTQHKTIQAIHSVCLYVFCIMASQCFVQEKWISGKVKGDIARYAIAMLRGTTAFGVAPSTFSDTLSLSSSILHGESLLLYVQINEQIQDHSADRLCFDILSFLYSLHQYGISGFSFESSQDQHVTHAMVIELLFHLLMDNTPRLQMLALRYCSLLLPHVTHKEIENIISNLDFLSSTTGAVQLRHVSDFLLFLFDATGWTLMKQYSPFQPTPSTPSTPPPSDTNHVVGVKRVPSPSIHEEGSGSSEGKARKKKRRKLSHFTSTDKFSDVLNSSLASHPLASSLFKGRDSREQIIIAQELCRFLRSLLSISHWKKYILDCLYEALDNIPELLDGLGSEESQKHHERLIAALSIMGGHEDIPNIRDPIQWSLPGHQEEKCVEMGTLLDHVGHFYYVRNHTTSDNILIDTARVHNTPAVPYVASMVPLSSTQMKHLISLIHKDYFHTKHLYLLQLSQRVIHSNLLQFMKHENILRALSSNMMDISLTKVEGGGGGGGMHSLAWLKSRLASLKERHLQHSQISTSLMSVRDGNDVGYIPPYYASLKEQFDRRFPYSMFHYLNLNGIRVLDEKMESAYRIERDHSLLVPCGMMVGGGTKISNEIINDSLSLSMTIVTWANYSIPPFPVLLSFYFEMEIKFIAPGGDVGLGILDDQADCDHSDGMQIGSVMGSYGYLSNGCTLAESSEPDPQQKLVPYTTGDIIGCLFTYTSEEGDHLLSFTKNGTLLRFQGEEDGHMHLPNLTLKFCPIVGLRGNTTRVEMNFGHKPFLYDTLPIASSNASNKQKRKEITYHTVPPPTTIHHKVTPLELFGNGEMDEEIDDLSDSELLLSDSDSESEPNELSSPTPLPTDMMDDTKNYIWNKNNRTKPLLTQPLALKRKECTETGWISSLRVGDLVLLDRNSIWGSHGFYQRLVTIAAIDYVSQFVLVVQRRKDLARERSWWIRLCDLTVPDLPFSTPNQLLVLLHSYQHDMVLLEARETFLSLLSYNLSYFIQLKSPCHDRIAHPKEMVQLHSVNLLHTMMGTPKKYIAWMKLSCTQFLHYSVLHEKDYRRLDHQMFSTLPQAHATFQTFLSCLQDYFIVIMTHIHEYKEESKMFKLLFEEIGSTLESGMEKNDFLDPQLKIKSQGFKNIIFYGTRLSNQLVIVPHKECTTKPEKLAIYLSDASTTHAEPFHVFSSDCRASITSVVVPQEECWMFNQSSSTEFDGLLLPCGELRTNESVALHSFHFQFYATFLSMLCDVQHITLGNGVVEAIGPSRDLFDFLCDSKHVDMLCMLLQKDDCIVKPHIALLLSKLVATQSEAGKLEFPDPLLSTMMKYVGTKLFNNRNQKGYSPFSLTYCEFMVSALSAKLQAKGISTQPESIADLLCLIQKHEETSSSNTKESAKELQQKLSKYLPIVQVFPILLHGRDIDDLLFKSLMASHFTPTVTRESEHPCKHSQRERVSFPGASSITVYFDHRCRLDYGDVLTFSIHNRRGADDLGRYHFQRWNTLEVANDGFYYELKLNKSPETDRYEYGYRFTAVPHYNTNAVDRILETHRDDVILRTKKLRENPLVWSESMNLQFISFVQNLAAAHCYSPITMTPADLIFLMTSNNKDIIMGEATEGHNEGIEGKEGEKENISKVQLPDATHYPHISDVPLYQLQFRFGLIGMLNARLSALIQNTEMNLVEEWWSLAHKFKQVRSLIFSSIKLDFIRIHNPEETPYKPYPFKVTIDRRLAQESNSARDSSFHQLYRQLFDRIDVLKHRAFYRSQPFEVSLQQEGAIDQGGPYRDCLMQVISEIQGENSTLALFIIPTHVQADQEFFIPNPTRSSVQHKQHYQFVGQLLGMCLRTGDSIPCHFAPIVWKCLVAEPIFPSDYEIIDATLYQKVKAFKRTQKMAMGDFYDEFGSVQYFTVITDDGEVQDLVDGGSQKKVTCDNCDEFIGLLVDRVKAMVSPQIHAIRDGFLQIVPASIVPLLTAMELQERIAGKRDIDIEYLKRHTLYDVLTEDSPEVKYLWDTLHGFTNEQRSLFLRFVWGRSTLPSSPEEFTEKFCVTRMISDSVGSSTSEDQKLPIAHTCSFQLELPQYSSEKILREKLVYAITNCRDIDLEWQSGQDSQ